MAWTTYSTRWTDVRANSDANYRILGKWVSDRLTDLGWGKTADTGQIDWSSATRPGAPTANTIGGYEIRVSSGAGTDIYLKISYGMGYNTTCIGFWIQTGEGSNGSGTLTGDTSTQYQMGSAIGTTSPYESMFYLSGDTDNFVFGGQDVVAANGCVFGVQRTCDTSGVDTNTGWWQYGMGYINVAHSKCQYVAFTGGAATADSNALTMLNVNRTSAFQSEGCILLPIYGQDGSTFIALRDIMSSYCGIMLTPNSVPHYGSTRTYVNIISTTSANVWGFTQPSTVSLGIRTS